jgi:hypothetical protein
MPRIFGRGFDRRFATPSTSLKGGEFNEETMTRERLEPARSASGPVSTRGAYNARTVPAACIAGVATLLLGCVCMADAFVVPGLFGPVAAAVVATERLLCAARASSARAAGAWTAIAIGWIAVASCMLHVPWVGARALPWAVALLVVSGIALRWRARRPASDTATVAMWVAAVGAASQLAILYAPLFRALLGAPAAPLVQIAAAASVELVLIGLVRLLDAACLRSAMQASVGRLLPHAPAVATAEIFDLEAGIA